MKLKSMKIFMSLIDCELLEPGALEYALSKGGFLIEFENGDIQAWQHADEDVEKLPD